MQHVALDRDLPALIADRRGRITEFTFPLSPVDQQVDVVYHDRPGEVHINLALGRLCSVGCRECSATVLGRQLPSAVRGNLAPDAIWHKLRGILAHLAPLAEHRRLIVSTMNDGDPLTRPADELRALVVSIFAVCAEAGVRLDRLNLSSSLIPNKAAAVIALADQYRGAFGTNLVQLQGSLLATHVKQNTWAGDGRYLRTMVETLAYYGSRMRAATGRGATWVNYVAVRRGDFGRADGAEQLDSVAPIAEELMRANGAVLLKITRGAVDDLEGWQQLDLNEYARFVAAVRQRWGAQLDVYAPDLAESAPSAYRCGKIQALAAQPR